MYYLDPRPFFLLLAITVTLDSILTMHIDIYFRYKGWGALLGRRLAERGIIVACIDYRYSECISNDAEQYNHSGHSNSGCKCFVCRNFPQGTIGDMVEDASQGISFVCNNIASYGGDPSRFITYSCVNIWPLQS